MPEQAVEPGRNKDNKEAEQPQNLLHAHHQEGHGDRGFGSMDQPGHDQLEGLFSLA